MAAPTDASGFYFDPEILGGSPPAPSSDPPLLVPDLLAYLHAASASAPTTLSSPAYEDGAPSLPDPPSRPEEAGVVVSEQVRAFWERYRAYPKYLKNVTKRKKRKDRKGREDRQSV
jgi:hypothetical protein